MPPNLFTGFISTDFPIEQAPVDGADGFEDDNLAAAPQSPPHNIGASSQRNLGSADWGVFGSMKIVLFKSKLNLLIPCGFLAILIDYTSQNQVISIHDSSICRTSTTAFACLWSFIDVVTLFSEGLGVSSQPVGYNSFGRAIGFRYRVTTYNFPPHLACFCDLIAQKCLTIHFLMQAIRTLHWPNRSPLALFLKHSELNFITRSCTLPELTFHV